MAIIPERISERLIKQYSDRGKKLRQVFDRSGGKVTDTLFDSAVDVIVFVNGEALPRYYYIETEQDVEVVEEDETNKVNIIEEVGNQ